MEFGILGWVWNGVHGLTWNSNLEFQPILRYFWVLGIFHGPDLEFQPNLGSFGIWISCPCFYLEFQPGIPNKFGILGWIFRDCP